MSESDALEMLHAIAAKNGELVETIAVLRVQLDALTTERDGAEAARQRAVMLKKQAETQTTRTLVRCQELNVENAFLQAEIQRYREVLRDLDRAGYDLGCEKCEMHCNTVRRCR
jgi:FtsZ-binding cell division protein ZapB